MSQNEAPLAPPPPARRDLLQQVKLAGAAVAGAGALSACATGAAAAGARPQETPAAGGTPTGSWDMSWRQKLGRYRTAYDSPEIAGGAALAFAAAALEGYREALGAQKEFTPVLILRHAASVMTLNDAMWERLAMGESRKLKDPTSGEPAKRNPFIGWKQGDRHTMVGRQAGLDVLMQQGAIVMACNRALTGVAYTLRQKEPSTFAATQEGLAQALAEVRKHVLPGVYVMPNGIFAVAAAQDVGCNYMNVPA